MKPKRVMLLVSLLIAVSRQLAVCQESRPAFAAEAERLVRLIREIRAQGTAGRDHLGQQEIPSGPTWALVTELTNQMSVATAPASIDTEARKRPGELITICSALIGGGVSAYKACDSASKDLQTEDNAVLSRFLDAIVESALQSSVPSGRTWKGQFEHLRGYGDRAFTLVAGSWFDSRRPRSVVRLLWDLNAPRDAVLVKALVESAKSAFGTGNGFVKEYAVLARCGNRVLADECVSRNLKEMEAEEKRLHEGYVAQQPEKPTPPELLFAQGTLRASSALDRAEVMLSVADHLRALSYLFDYLDAVMKLREIAEYGVDYFQTLTSSGGGSAAEEARFGDSAIASVFADIAECTAELKQYESCALFLEAYLAWGGVNHEWICKDPRLGAVKDIKRIRDLLSLDAAARTFRPEVLKLTSATVQEWRKKASGS